PLAIHHLRVESALAGGGDHVGRRVDADHRGARLGDLLGEHAVTASEIQNSLAAPRFEQIQHWLAERGHKMSVLRVTLGAPRLPGLGLWHRVYIYFDENAGGHFRWQRIVAYDGRVAPMERSYCPRRGDRGRPGARCEQVLRSAAGRADSRFGRARRPERP